jgi:hypothetical protein
MKTIKFRRLILRDDTDPGPDFDDNVPRARISHRERHLLNDDELLRVITGRERGKEAMNRTSFGSIKCNVSGNPVRLDSEMGQRKGAHSAAQVESNTLCSK